MANEQRFINPNSLQQQQYDYLLKRQESRRFSYASMLSDSDHCYSPHQDDFQPPQNDIVSPTPTVNSFIDPIYVDLQKPMYYKNYNAYSPYYPPMPTPTLVNRPMTPVSPPLLMKEAITDDKAKKQPRSRGRRVSNIGNGTRMFTCKFDGCGKVFKRSEHLKRHIRSIHTLEKPFECPYQSCNKRFSRSDNLNQHIRIHRHNNTKDSTIKTMNKNTNMKLETINSHFNNTNTTFY